MRLLRFGPPGSEKPGLLDTDNTIRDLSDVIDDITPANLSDEALKRLGQLDPASLPIVDDTQRLGPCVSGSGKYLCVGLNYSDHAEESGMTPPPEPILFMKATSAIVGPDDDVILPRRSEKSDWEVELGIVIGSEARYVSEQDALNHIAGYCVLNDLSERAFQLERSGQWVKGKSADTFGPVGPYLVTRDEVPEPNNLRLWLEVDGKRFQDGTTANMIFKVPYLVSYISQFMTLMPGDIIATGTPAGVGMGQSPKVYLQEGNTMRLGVEGLGEQTQRVVSPR
ncbi:fumarylacetoacetate hydrolase family protein [Halomonas kalidii]|uniref:Fumarylacetoacetate hydrolase family protein n=1 Tax=Halomonas kalidii TaxID=3043293 RepID=A0ABT6VMW9_9GAMM|nr:fumarylacetoacetate hydrolase family protein [Halomonas kalidii]MDI5935317.1 fumarylacetoacetate hydrolase family protein [Halomonas kalidii]